MKIAVTGSTGQLGRLIVKKLKDKVPVEDVIALARSVNKADSLGVQVREADYAKPETLLKALEGVDTLMLVSSSEVGKRAVQHRNVIEAAKSARVGRIVYTSLLRADTSTLDLAAEHAATEKDLKGSGIPFTILRNGWYTENYTGSIAGALAGGAFLGSAGDGEISSATREDLAEAAVVVLTSGGHEGKTYELAGDDSYTLSDLASEISRQTGMAIEYKDLPAREYASALAGFGLPAALAEAIAGWDREASTGALFDNGKQLSALIGRPTTTLSDAVKQALRSAAAAVASSK